MIHAFYFSSSLAQHAESRLGSHLPPVEDASVVAKLMVSQRKLNVFEGHVQSSEYGRCCCDLMQSNGVDLLRLRMLLLHPQSRCKNLLAFVFAPC